MIRADHILIVAGSAMAGLGGGALLLLLTAPEASAPTGTRIDTAIAAPQEPGAARQDWPAIFGEPPADAPPEPAEPPPEALPDYTLKGLVAAADQGWAIVSGPDDDHLVGPGSTLPDGGEVVAIRTDGVEVDRDGGRFVIGFARDEGPQERVTAGTAMPDTTSRTLSLASLRETGMRKALGLAGGSKVVDRGNGALAQEIVWVRNGRLYDRIGLRKGDTVLTINGIPAGDIDALREAAPDLMQERSFDLEVLRSGARLTLKVVIDEKN
jgi:general secretion pathway protein C